MRTIYFILLSVLLVTAGQLTLKKGLTNLGDLDFDKVHLAETVKSLFTSPLILLGIFFFAFSSILWLTALSRTELSFAYPLLSIGYAFVAIGSWFFFNENLSLKRIAGIAVVIIGVSILSLNGEKR